MILGQTHCICISGVNMKRKPDAMMALIALFFIGLVVSGFSSMTVGSNRPAVATQMLSYQVEETDKTIKP